MPPLLLGHRGARNYAPENTFAAFDLTLQHGCDGFEFDVRASADLHPIIVHDPHLDDIVIADFAAERLFSLNRAIPQMWQVFEQYGGRAHLNVELKVVGLEERVAELMETYAPRDVMVSSFLPEVIRRMHEAAPRVPLGYVVRWPHLVRRWKKLPVTHVVVHYLIARDALIRELKAEGKQVFIWTVNDQEQMRRFADLGVDAIISDDTLLLSETFSRRRDAAPA